MCDKIKLPILSPRQWSLGSWGGKFSPSSTSPAAFGSLLMEDFCDMLDVMEESERRVKLEGDKVAKAQEFPDPFAGVFGNSCADDCVSVSDDSVSTSSSTDAAPSTGLHFPQTSFFDVTANRHSAIARWKAKKSAKKSGLVKVCKARSDVAMSRPRVKGKFVKKIQFVSVTELQGY